MHHKLQKCDLALEGWCFAISYCYKYRQVIKFSQCNGLGMVYAHETDDKITRN